MPTIFARNVVALERFGDDPPAPKWHPAQLPPPDAVGPFIASNTPLFASDNPTTICTVTSCGLLLATLDSMRMRAVYVPVGRSDPGVPALMEIVSVAGAVVVLSVAPVNQPVCGPVRYVTVAVRPFSVPSPAFVIAMVGMVGAVTVPFPCPMVALRVVALSAMAGAVTFSVTVIVRGEFVATDDATLTVAV